MYLYVCTYVCIYMYTNCAYVYDICMLERLILTKSITRAVARANFDSI